MSKRSRSGNGEPDASLAPLLIGLGVIAAVAAVWFGYPAGPVLWLAVAAAAWTEPNPVLTGKTRSGQPVPAGAREAAALRQHRFLASLRVSLIAPTRAWLPGRPVQATFLLAVSAALLAIGQPLTPRLSTAPGSVPTFGLANAGCAWLVVAACGHAARASAQHGCPGTHTGALCQVLSGTAGRVMLGAGLLAGAVAPVALSVTATPHLPPHTQVAFLAAGLATGLPVLALLPVWRRAALSQWRTDCAARAEWAPRWEGLRIEPAPYLLHRATVGNATVDTFDAPTQQGAAAFTTMLPKLAPSLGAARHTAILNVPDTDSSSRPIPATTHPVRFVVASWAAEQVPDLTDPGTDPDEARVFAQAAFAQVTDGRYTGRMLLLEMEPVTTGGSPRVAWRTTWASPVGLTLATLRSREETGPLSEALRAEVLIDHRAPCLYVGALSDPDTQFSGGQDDGQDMATVLEGLAREDHWNQIWATSSRQSANQPTIAHPTYREARLAGGQLLHRQAFVTRVGVDPLEYFGTEARLSASMQAAPYVAVTGWPAPGQRPGERHPQGLAVYWSAQPVPDSPATLPPTPGHPGPGEDPAVWVLAGLVNKAFAAARLARPEVVTARAMTAPRARRHLWRIRLRLHDGVLAGDVRAKREKLRQSLGVAWLRVTDAPDGVDVYAGDGPDVADLADPGRDTPTLTALDWEQAFLDARLVGSGGGLPRLVSAGRLEHNGSIADLEFELPAGLDTLRLRGALERLRTATGSLYLDVRPAAAGPSRARVLASPSNPLPESVAVDFALLDEHLAGTGVRLFGTGVEGEPVGFDPRTDPHALLAGLTGAGKSSLAQVILYGSVLAGDLVVVIDPVKGGADFAFLKPYLWGLADDAHTAAATMQAIYTEVVRRKDLNSRHGVGSYRDLPEDLRPRHITVFVDEFTSLIGKDAAPARSDDPDTEREREHVEALNTAKLKVGTFAGRFAREARAAGVTLLLGTQKLNAKLLDQVPGGMSDLKANLARSLLGNSSQGDRQSALRDWQAAPRLDPPFPPGRGLWESNTGRPEPVQCWFATQEQYAQALSERVDPLPARQRLDPGPYLPKSDADDGFGPPPGLFGPGGQPPDGRGGPVDDRTAVGSAELELSLDDLEAYLEPDRDLPGPAPAASGQDGEHDASPDRPPETGIRPGEARLVLSSLFEPAHGSLLDEPVAAIPGTVSDVTGWGDELDWGRTRSNRPERPDGHDEADRGTDGDTDNDGDEVDDGADELFSGPVRTDPALVHPEADPFG